MILSLLDFCRNVAVAKGHDYEDQNKQEDFHG